MFMRIDLYTSAKFFLIGIFSLDILFHIAIISGFISYHIVWGGRLTSDSQMYQFEAVSLSVNLIFLVAVLVKSSILKVSVSAIIVKYVLFIASFIFAVNTVGNLLSLNSFENLVFTPITFLLSIFCFIVAKQKNII